MSAYVCVCVEFLEGNYYFVLSSVHFAGCINGRFFGIIDRKQYSYYTYYEHIAQLCPARMCVCVCVRLQWIDLYILYTLCACEQVSKCTSVCNDRRNLYNELI